MVVLVAVSVGRVSVSVVGRIGRGGMSVVVLDRSIVVELVLVLVLSKKPVLVLVLELVISKKVVLVLELVLVLVLALVISKELVLVLAPVIVLTKVAPGTFRGGPQTPEQSWRLGSQQQNRLLLEGMHLSPNSQ